MDTAPPPTFHPEGLRAPGSGPEDRNRPTRKRLAPWDRLKFLFLLTLAFAILTWNQVASFNGIMPLGDAILTTAMDATWIFWLAGLEVIRQIHFLISERAAGYHGFFTKRVFGGWDRWTHRTFSDWTRFRLARAIKYLIWVAVIAMVVGKLIKEQPIVALFKAPALLLQGLPYAFQLAFGLLFGVIQIFGIFWFMSRGGVETYFPDDIKTRFRDVWGQDHVVERVKENIVFLEQPDAIEARGGYVPSGLLLWGPPGTGKTLMAEAVAGETGKPYVFVDPGAFINMFMGVGILKVKALFRKLRKLALRYGGVIVFFDEADSLGRRGQLAQQGPPGRFSPMSGDACHGFSYLSEGARDQYARFALRAGAGPAEAPRAGISKYITPMGMNGGGDMGTLQALLTELSGLKKPRGFVNRYVRRMFGMQPKPPPRYRILVMMATNMPNALDEALLRPGRIDRIYKVGYPSKPGRIRTYQGYFDKVRHNLTDEQIDKLATITPYATGATIKDVVNESLIVALRDGREVITWGDVVKAKRIKQLGPPEDVEYIERERHAVAVHEACHAVVAYRSRYHLEIDLATIEKGSDYLGMVSSIKPEDQFTGWKSEKEADIMVSLASLAGERMFFGDDNSSGVSGDLQSATYFVGLMESEWGMGKGIASLPILHELGIMSGRTGAGSLGGAGGTKPGAGFTGSLNDKKSDEMIPDHLAERIEFNLSRLLDKTEELLKKNRREVLAVAHALEHHKTLDGEDVVAVIEKTRGPLVDGTVYADEVFMEDIEAYHLAAVEAHQNHSKVDHQLPVPPEKVLELEPSAVVMHKPTFAAPSAQGQVGLAAATLQETDANGNGHGVLVPQPDFVPWSSPGNGNGNGLTQVGAEQRPYGQPHYGPTDYGPAGAPARPRKRSAGLMWVLALSVAGLVAFTLLGVALFGGSGATGAEASSFTAGGAAILFVVLIGVLVGVAVIVGVVKGQQASRRRAEEARDRAAERAQLLAAAMDPEVAMRLLGYDGRRGGDNQA
ncbi:AAA family ATPase [Streptosporangiaceae bacterium NEAU-GS5]|nr:AAA family ATPase [Streptosporangiaceae bacterium NEAU-GS5]